MRWIFIVWMTFLACVMIGGVFYTNAYATQINALFDDCVETFSEGDKSSEQQDAMDSLCAATASLKTLLFGPGIKVLYTIAMVLGVCLLAASLALLLRRFFAPTFTLVVLALAFAWQVNVIFTKEYYRQQTRMIYTDIYSAAGILVGEEVTFSPKLEEALASSYWRTTAFAGWDLVLLLLFVLKRHQIMEKMRTKQQPQWLKE